MIEIDVKSLDSVSKLNRLSRGMPKAIRRGLQELGNVGKAEAKKRCPISPTKAQAQDAGSGFNIGAAPGELSNAISYKTTPDDVKIGIYHGPATKYANKIHNGQGKSWQKIGPGSEAKASQTGEEVGGLFLDRAVDDMDIEGIMDAVISKALRRS